MFDFSALPPEINSARMYSGAGSGPMLAAGSAWRQLAAELRSTADTYNGIISNLISDGWHGPASESMSAAAAPYAEWMNTAAAQAERTAEQAHAAVTAYETAFSMTVPPAEVTANRTHLHTLVATNILGQHTAAIAATEAHYAQMWAQDAAAMHGYTGSATVASQLAPFSGPAQSTSEAGVAAQSAAVTQATATGAGSAGNAVASASSGLSSMMSSANSSSGSASASSLWTELLTGLTNLLSNSNNSAASTFLDSNFLSTMVLNGALAGGPFNPQFILGSIAGFSFLQETTAGAAEAGLLDEVTPVALSEASLGGLGGLDSSVSAAVGEAGQVGVLSTPGTWTQAAQTTPLNAALGRTPMAVPLGGGGSPAGGAGGFAPMLTGAAATRRRRPIPKYGMRLPPVMSHPPAAG